jgi:hypothetical protein
MNRLEMLLTPKRHHLWIPVFAGMTNLIGNVVA